MSVDQIPPSTCDEEQMPSCLAPRHSNVEIAGIQAVSVQSEPWLPE